jgi:hypothetical protein
MSFGFSVGDLITTSELILKTHNSLKDHSSPSELVQCIDNLSTAYLEIERIGLDNLTQQEVNTICEISRISRSLATDVLDHLPAPTKLERWHNWRRKKKDQRVYSEWVALSGTLAQALAVTARSQVLLETRIGKA